MARKDSKRIAVLGGGPAGLAAAYAAARAGVSVDVYEAERQTGGNLRSVRVSPRDTSSFAVDLGPASMKMKYPKVLALIREHLQLENMTLERTPKEQTVFILRDGALERLPSGPGALLKSRLLSFQAKMGIFFEPFARKLRDEKLAREETVDAFFGRRFSPEFVRYVVDPTVGGIYSGDVGKLSMRHAFRQIWDTERKKGSVIMPMLTSKRPEGAQELTRTITFAGGMQTLPAVLQTQLEARGGKVHLGRRVRSVNRGKDGFWRVNRRGKYDAVISSLPAYALREVRSNIPSIQQAFERLSRKVRYAAIGTVTFGFRRDQVAHPLNGIGVLIPSAERRGVLGVRFLSEEYVEKSRGEAEKDKVFVTAYVGGVRNPGFASQSEKVAEDSARKEVSQLLGVKGEPCFSRAHIWKKGIPQYEVGHDAVVYTARRLEISVPGLVLAGNYKDGVGLPDALLSGLQAAERALKYVEKVRSMNDPHGKAWPVDT